MRALLWLLGIFAAAVGLAMLAGVNDGYALLVLPPWRVQISLNLLLVALVAAFLLLNLLLRLFARAAELPGRVGAYRARRRKDKAGQALREALRTLFEGRFAQALKHAGTAFAAGERAPVAALVAARAAHAMRDDTRYRLWLGRAAEQDEAVRIARLMTEAELAVEGRRFQEAAERLEQLRGAGQRHIAALRLSLKVASALGHWEEVLRLARQLKKHKALSDEQAQPLLRRAHLERLALLAREPETIASYWRAMPPAEQADRRLVERAVPHLAAAGQGALARKTLERLLDAEWDGALARLYACCAGDEAVACLARAEGWLRSHPRDPGLLYALGRLCLAAQLWGKAQSYLEASLNQLPSIDTHLALAGLLERLEREAEAQAHYRAAAQLSAAVPRADAPLALPVPAAVTPSRVA